MILTGDLSKFLKLTMNESTETIQTNNKEQKYANNMTAQLEAEKATIEMILENPPQSILMHVYWVEYKDDGKVVPNLEGRYAVGATAELLDELLAVDRSYHPDVYIAGGHGEAIDPVHQTSLSKVYYGALYHKVLGYRKTDRINFKPEYLTELDDNAQDVSFWPAVETRGELMYLKSQIPEGQRALAIARFGHAPRIQKLAAANGINLEVVTVEGILNYFHPDAVAAFTNYFPQIIEDEYNFSKAEKMKLAILSTIDPWGALTETLARSAGPAKKFLFKILGQKV